MGCSPEGPLATIGVPVGTVTGAGATSRTATGMGAGAASGLCWGGVMTRLTAAVIGGWGTTGAGALRGR